MCEWKRERGGRKKNASWNVITYRISIFRCTVDLHLLCGGNKTWDVALSRLVQDRFDRSGSLCRSHPDKTQRTKKGKSMRDARSVSAAPVRPIDFPSTQIPVGSATPIFSPLPFTLRYRFPVSRSTPARTTLGTTSWKPTGNWWSNLRSSSRYCKLPRPIHPADVILIEYFFKRVYFFSYIIFLHKLLVYIFCYCLQNVVFL